MLNSYPEASVRSVVSQVCVPSFFAGVISLAFTLGALPYARAQTAASFPSKPIRIMAVAPGGVNDVLARIIGQKWTELWGHPVVIDNRGGAGGTISVAAGASAPADGYTLIMGATSNVAIAVGMYPKLGYDPLKLTPITNVASVPYVLAVNPSVPARNVRELVAIGKSKKGLLNYGTAGVGGITHLAAELFISMSGADIVHVPYKGTVAAVTDLVAGRIDMILAAYSSIAPHAKTGKLRVLAVTGSKRSSAAPQLPTIAEAGVKGYSVDPWFGLVAPPGVPKDIVNKLNSATINALKSPDVVKRFMGLGYEAIGDTPAQFGATIRNDVEKYVRVISSAGIKPQEQ